LYGVLPGTRSKLGKLVSIPPELGVEFTDFDLDRGHPGICLGGAVIFSQSVAYSPSLELLSFNRSNIHRVDSILK